MLCGVAALAASGCGEPPRSSARDDPADVVAARERAVAYFAEHVAAADPSWASLFGYMHRRFGLSAVDTSGRPLHARSSVVDRDGWAAIYRRLDDPDARISAERIATIESQTDRMTALALHCDEVGVPTRWPEVLRAASEAGGYALTHAALATRWSRENGCLSDAGLATIESMQRERLARMAASRDALEDAFANGTDLWLESMAMLYYLEGGDRLDTTAVQDVVATQRSDGGWAAHPSRSRSDPHATALALWVLLENEQADAPPIRWIVER